jgi:uncharacterized membrane protein YdfJ with MMPL/SSD domain
VPHRHPDFRAAGIGKRCAPAGVPGPPKGQSLQARLGQTATAFLVISRTDGQPLSASDRALADHVADGLTRLEASHPGGAGQGPPARVRVGPAADSPNDLAELAPVSFGAVSGTPGTDQAVANLRSDVAGELAGTGLRAQLTGQAASDADNSLTQELAINGMLLAILILLFLLFRSPGVPFLVVLAICGAGSGVTALLNIAAHIGGFQLDQATTSLLPVVLFGVGTDYAVFLLYRYRDRLRAGDDHKTAMTAAVARVGRAMVASALAMVVSFSAMAVSGLLTFRILGPSLAPLYLMASVVLGFAATLGASVLLFQHVLGHDGIDFQLPLVVYLFVASIGTDYNILIISRLREEMWRGTSPRQAAVTAVRSAGPAVAAAGLVLATSFGLLMISPLIADIGFAVAAGVLLSAFINAFLLVPALTVLAGKAAWWPSRPRVPRSGHLRSKS